MIKTDTKEFATLVYAMEQDADKKKHNLPDERVAEYWQGRADALRIVLTKIPEFMWLNTDNTKALTYKQAKLLRDQLFALKGGSLKTIEEQDPLYQFIHDLDAFVRGVEYEMGIRETVNLEELCRLFEC